MKFNQTYLSICKPADQPRTRTLEETEDEIQLLREQIHSLLQQLSEQLLQQRELEIELEDAKQEIEMMNAENQHLVEAKLLFLRELKEVARSLPVEGISGKALLKLLSKFYEEIAPFEAPKTNRSFIG